MAQDDRRPTERGSRYEARDTHYDQRDRSYDPRDDRYDPRSDDRYGQREDRYDQRGERYLTEQPASRTRFYRDKRRGKLMGVCAGIADYTGFDVNLVRVCLSKPYLPTAADDRGHPIFLNRYA